MAKFSERLRSLRNERGLSQQELANQLRCVSKSSVNMYERGEREPNFETLEAIADYFNVDMDYLLGKTNTPNIYRELMAEIREENESGRAKAKEEMFILFGTQYSTSSLRLIDDKVALLFYKAMERESSAAMSEIIRSLENLGTDDLTSMMLMIGAYLNADQPIKDIVNTALRPYVDKELESWT